MKKILVSVALIAVFTASELLASPADTSLTAGAQVSLTVQATHLLQKTRDLTFPAVYVGVTSETVDPVTGGSNPATFQLQGPLSESITITFPASISLTLTTGGSATITVAPIVAGNVVNNQSSAAPITSGNTYTTASAYDANNQTYYLWSGGTATLSPTQVAGPYSGQTADYNYILSNDLPGRYSLEFCPLHD